jgi:transketolase
VVASLNPPPTTDLLTALADVPLVVTVEAHYVTGGVGSLVAEVVAEHDVRCRLLRVGVRTSPAGHTGSQQYLYQRHGLTRESLVQTVLAQLDRVQVGAPR